MVSSSSSCASPPTKASPARKGVDTLFKEEREAIAPFAFASEVAGVFDDMANRSLPGYQELQRCSGYVAARFAADNSSVYDLGCSTGNTLLHLNHSLSGRPVRLIGVDASKSMLDECRKKLRGGTHTIELMESNLDSLRIENASVVFLHYTLQFTDPAKRAQILENIYRGLLTGGVLFISEKTLPNERWKKFTAELYHAFKRRNGYSQLEIDQKDRALEGVLRPGTEAELIALLGSAGFETMKLFQSYQFVSYLAFKR